MSDASLLRPVVIVGGGPAGIALLSAACRTGVLDSLAGSGLAIIEESDRLGSGALGGYAINGDSTAETFHSVVGPNAGAPLAALASHPAAQAIAARIGPNGGTPVPLTEVAALLDVVGDQLAREVTANGGSVRTGCRAVRATQRGDGIWETMLVDKAGRRTTLRSHNLVIATGGWQPDARLHTDMVEDAQGTALSLAARAEGRLIASNTALGTDGGAMLAERLRGRAAPRIVVVGSSASALAACRVALGMPDARVTLLHRRKLRVFYPSAAAARADGYADFGDSDICPVSGFVYRLAGFRLEARALVQSALQVGGRAPHPRFALHRLVSGPNAQAAALLDGADLVIHALGYQPRGLPVFGANGRRLGLAADAGLPMTDGACRVRSDTGQPVAGLFGLGLAAGFVPAGHLGGEPSFTGQANGLWVWQNGAGALILDQLAPAARQEAA